MKPLLRLALSTSALVLATSAHAQEPTASSAPPPSDANVCKDSYEQAQIQMKPTQGESRLLVARESLRTCLRSGCRDWIVADCSKWLGEVEARIPSVVFSAKTSNGDDLAGTKVMRPDGSAVVERLDGHAVELEPGPYDFVFLTADGRRLEKHALVREGEKAQAIAAVFESPEPLAGAQSSRNPERPGRTDSSPPTLRYVGYGALGLGIVGLGVGAVFGLVTISKKNDLDCDASGGCASGPLSDARKTATISDVAFVAGGALAAAGVTLVLLSPSRKVEARVTTSGVVFGGRF